MGYEKLLELKEIMEKKKECLQEILLTAKVQAELILTNEDELDLFGEYIGEKENLIRTLNQISEEHEELIKVSAGADLWDNNQDMVRQVNRLNQEIISLSREIEKLEEKSKENFESYIRQESEKIKSFRLNNQITSSYYKSMNGVQLEGSYFMDKRK